MKKILLVTLVINSCLDAFAHNYNTRTDFGVADTTPVKIQLERASFNDMTILFISDTAKQTQDIESIFSAGYRELMKYAQQEQLKPEKFLAWYYSVQPPWIMDIAMQVDRLPPEAGGRVKSRTEKGGEVLIAHMWGPYSELKQAYIQIEDWLNQNKRVARGTPFEVYLNDPSTIKDPSEIRTDIYQPLR